MSSLHPNSLTVGAVAIGRNEGKRLRDCLGSLIFSVDKVIYVDSGSTDASLSTAQELGVEFISLDTSIGFTAARARNAGFRRLLEIAPEIEFAQFVDADCTLDEGWIVSAVEFLRSHDEVAAVCGRQWEIEPQRNWYHRLANLEWDALPGEAISCGGNACMRVLAFQQVGGFRDSMIAGEEPELCTRLRAAGWRIWRLDHEMASHDIRMNHFAQWWRRVMRAGHAYTEGMVLHCSLAERHRVKKVCSIWFWALLPLSMIALAWITHGYSLLAMITLYLLLVGRIIRYRTSVHRDTFPNSCLYALACLLGKWAEAVGSLKYLWNLWLGKTSTLIEYNEASHTFGKRRGDRIGTHDR
jgi:GT2 family glycosyltransferase